MTTDDDDDKAATIARLIGTLATATLEPTTSAPARTDSHVTLDARGIDPWRNETWKK